VRVVRVARVARVVVVVVVVVAVAAAVYFDVGNDFVTRVVVVEELMFGVGGVLLGDES
jgi:hypothetical protein